MKIVIFDNQNLVGPVMPTHRQVIGVVHTGLELIISVDQPHYLLELIRGKGF